MAWRLGIDIGGTFTDVALVNDVDGTIGIAKTPTTPSDFGEAVLTGLYDSGVVFVSCDHRGDQFDSRREGRTHRADQYARFP